ncbi:MAG: pilus assembly protein PilY, partial [Geobacteraceae bacterium]|nr:pilus assembly protein PilY [Geobacteraceae bacterium]
MKTISVRLTVQLCLLLCPLFISSNAVSAVMNDYCIQPPFIAATVPPLVMFEMGREHKLFYEAYNDSGDLDDDGLLDVTYKHSIDYYGYFDPYKCYQYNTTGTDKFDPVSHTTTKFCSSSGGQWSGNILNWLTMSRIDELMKVLYGGYRSTDSASETVLERAAVPQDAHSWGKEFTGRLCYNSSGTPQYTYSCSLDSDCATGYACTDKSMELVGFAQAGLSTCTAATPGTTSNKMLVVRYRHPAALAASQISGDTHTDLLASFSDATEPLTSTFIDYDTTVTNFGTAGSKIDPTQDHLDAYSTMVVAEFKTSTGNGSETWQFMVDSDDGAEVEIFTTADTSLGVVASHYGAHSSCSTAPTTACAGMVTGSISLSKSSTWYRLVVRASEASGQDGVRVWYKNPSKTSWTLFGTTNLGNNNMRTFNISASNQCTLYASEFINKGKPTSGATSQDSSKYHMVCNTTLSATGAPLMRLLQNVSGKRIWDWASKERPVCDNSLGTPTDYEVRVKVCDSTIDTADLLDITKREIGDSCKLYPGSGAGVWKPVGLMQQYGEGDGSKVCSRNMSKSCNTDSDCTFATEGKCVVKSNMYFGLMTTSYTNNTSGGVLRKNISSILDEVESNNGTIQSSNSTPDNIITTINRLKLIGFTYGNVYAYQDPVGGNCGWISDRPLNEGECRSWGNPIAEMMYETLRYFAGKLSATPEYLYSTTNDSGLQLSKADWGYRDGSVYKSLYDVYPSCAKPFILLLSDTNTSYDSDQIPGSSYTKPNGSTFTEDTPVVLKLGETQSSGRTLLNDLAYTIGQTENITGNSWYIGENGTLKDFLCTGKSAVNFSLLRGMCPEEPTKMGSYYAAALSYYGKTKFKSITGKPDVNTFVVALSSPFSDLQIKTSSGTVSILPTAKSVSGCSSVYAGCAQRMNLTYDATYGMQLTQKSPADTAAYCPTNTIVDYYVDDIRYDSSNNVIYALFRINYEDVEQGADHDMDSIVKYEVCTATAATDGYGSCGSSTLAANQIEIKLVSDYAAGCIDQVMGFVISGTTEDGVYLPVKDKDVGSSDGDTPAVVASMPLTWSKEFTIGTTSSAKSLKNPLWYAAKWGGFEDKNGNNKPDLREEWAKDCTATDINQCNPDNYYQVVNPLKLRRQLNKALTDILRRVTSGTAASILNNSEGSGANLLQAVFYPAKSFDANTESQWIGEMQNLWYFLDPALQKTSIREDSNQNNTLNLKSDKVAQFYFDATENKTLVKLFSDADGDGAADSSTPDATVTPDEVRSLWKAGRMLWERNISTDPRTIYTGYNSTFGNAPQKFSNLAVDGYFNTWPNTWNILQIPAGTNAEREALATKLIAF